MNVYPGQRSYTIAGDMIQRLPFNLHARANVDYYSSQVSQQRYQQNIYDATKRTRRFGGNVTGNWGPYSFSGTADRNDYFQGTRATRPPDRCRGSRSPAASGRSAAPRSTLA